MDMAERTAWRMKGQVFIACNCDYGCPCNVNARPTHGHCEGGWVWHIEAGAYGEVVLDGLAAGLFADWPKAIHEGDGAGVYLIDERADPAQRAALQTLVEGQAGGPWAIFRKTFRELHGPRFAAFEVQDGQLPRVRAHGVELATEFIRNPVTNETIHPRIALPEGLVVKEASLLASSRFVVSQEQVQYDHSGSYAAHGFFQYFGP
jgi:hypothetical protein